MKNIYAYLLLLSILLIDVGFVNGQSVLFEDDFSSGSISAVRWPDNGGYTYSAGEIYGSVDRNNRTEYIETQSVVLSQYGNVLIYREDRTDRTGSTTCTVSITDDSGATYDVLLTYDQSTIDNTGATYRTIDLSSYSGSTVNIRFELTYPSGFSGADRYWYLDDINITGYSLENPGAFTITGSLTTQLDLGWSLNTLGEDILLAWSTDGVFGEPTGTYSVNDPITGGGTVLAMGASSSYSHTGLTEGQSYYYKIWSYDGSSEYSMGATTSGVTTSNTTFEDTDFESGLNGWTASSGWDSENYWYRGTGTSYRGSYSAYISEDLGVTPGYNSRRSDDYSLTKSISIPAYQSVSFSFFFKAMGRDGFATGELYVDGNLESEVDEFYGYTSWTEKVVDLTHYSGQTVDIEFRWKQTWGMDGTNPAFCVDDIRMTGSNVARLASFNASVIGVDDVELTWEQNSSAHPVVIAYSSNSTIGNLVDGVSYSVGDLLVGGGEIIYVGSALSYTHADVSGAVAYYKAWSNNGSDYSTGLSARTSLPVTLPFTEDFEGDVEVWNLGFNAYTQWVIGRAEANSGSKSAYVTEDGGITSSTYNFATTYDELTLPVNLKGFQTATLDFAWQFGNESSGEWDAQGDVYIDNNQLNAGDLERTSAWGGSESYSLDAYLGNISLIRFVNRTGWNASETPGFCIDDVVIDGTIYPVQAFTVENYNTLANNLSWTKHAQLDEVIVAYSFDAGAFGEPVKGQEYVEGDVFTAGGTIIYAGTGTSFTHEPLQTNRTYYYKIWHKSGLIYSTSLTGNATTPDNVRFFEDWENDITGWTLGSSTTNAWTRGTAEAFQGTQSAYVSSDGGMSADYDTGDPATIWLEHAIDLRDFGSAKLAFYYKVDGNISDYGAVYLDGVQVGSNLNNQTVWTKLEIDLSAYIDQTPTLRFMWVNASGSAENPGLCLDNIAITGTYDEDSEISAGAGVEPDDISSIVDTQAEELTVLDFDITDLGTADTRATVFHQITFTQGDNNQIANWTNAIAGASLYGPDLGESTGVKLSGVINATNIVFESDSMIVVEDGTIENYELRIWLNSSLESTLDNQLFEFRLDVNDMVVYDGSGFKDDLTQMVESGDAKNALRIIATQLQFTQQPSAYASVDQALATQPVVAGTDENGNVDTDYTGTIVITNSGGIAMTYSDPGVASGEAIYTDLTFTASGGPVTLTATDGVLTDGISNNVLISNYCTGVPLTNTSFITLVNLNTTIDNYTGADGGYGNYLDQSTSLTRNNEYTVTVGYDLSGTRNISIWIDYDGGDDFDASEQELSVSRSGSGVVNATFTVPSGAALGATRMRVMVTNQTIPSDGCHPDGIGDGEVEDYTIILTDNSWQGQNTDWTADSNWSSGSVPNGTSVYIPEHPLYGDRYPIIISSVSIGDIEIANNASLTIKPGALVDVDGDVTVNGDFIIENTNASPASVITNTAASITGDVTVRWTYDELHWWFTGHSISNPTIATYQGILTDLSNPGNKYVLYDYTDAGSFVNLGSTGTEFNQGVTSGERIRGYQLKVLNPSTVVEHVGALNNQVSYSKEVQNGWQIIANPYPAYYQLPKVADDSGDFAATEGTVYVSDSDTNDDKQFLTYSVFTTIAVPETFDGVIAPNQAFYIKTKDSEYDSGKLITMDAANRTNASSTPSLKSVSTTPQNLLRFYLSNEHGLTDEAVIALFPEGDLALNTQDSKQRMYTGTNYSYIYSMVEGTKTVINILPEDLEDFQQILGIQTKAGEQELRISGVDELGEQYEIVLEDKRMDTFTTMTNASVYAFTAEEGVDHERFVLHFKTSKTEVPTDIDDIHSEDGAEVKVYVQNESSLKVTCEWDLRDKTIEVFTISGSLMMNDEFSGEVYEAELNVQPGIYIVKVSGGEQVYQQKVFVK
ncbi:T9SS type A sorting domain-containing protein [Carboxylicivirga sp. A043]|uniref:T9SS type A sorting domain-containing protein n=1 Tax=Carboxylicivirga litoralis TaxID=2816963 RepID=UPI0021CAF4EB|nr:T9SS type A sorting domain-containing protein [Carboxylicivirga sp. A043]MCU4156226.1 T9SS type A sorting domain-containing protein [Carboxylicivirga sp. A043]